MPTISALLKSARLLLLLAVACPAWTWAEQPPTDVMAVDLEPLIIRAAAKPDAFAVNIPRSASPQSNGQWTTAGAGALRWQYTVRIPDAVSVSFHAASAYLPPSAVLTVTGDRASYVYAARDVHRGGLWSRVAQGDILLFDLRVAAADAAKVRLSIDSFQAGYRSLKAGVPNHPAFDRYRRQALQIGDTAAASASSTGCVENFSCHVTPDDKGPGQSTVALIIGNQFQCSGVLLNDVAGDGTPYVLTARHCEKGDPNGGAPEMASSLAVYWDAVSACGATLGSIYDSGISWQYGAATLVEQQDAWLVKLDQSPAVDDAYFAGWDATGAGFVGGYTPHHALGIDRQYAGWYGQAHYDTVPAKSLGVGFNSTFWDTVNEIGSIGPGASGSGLFDADNRLVGTVVRGLDLNDTGVCPANPPKVPSATSATALSTALAGIFSSTADPVSSTGATTLQSVLDPGDTGQTVVNGSAMPPYIYFSSSSTGVQNTGTAQPIDWYVVNATTCTATGGTPGDGWSGPLDTTGVRLVTEFYAGTVKYGISCSNATRTVTAELSITWAVITPQVAISEVGLSPVAGTPFELNWNASLAPCTGSGAVSANGWNGSQIPFGDATFTEAAPGSYTYKLTCGSGSHVTSAQVVVTVAAPSVSVSADATNLRVGQYAYLTWQTVGAPCVASGGAAGDGWIGTQFGFAVTELVAGTYTYTLTCGTGAYTAAAQVSVTYTNDPPVVTLTLTPNQGTVANASNVGYTLIRLDWSANLRPCVLSVTGPNANADLPTYPYLYTPNGTVTDTRAVIGSYVYTATCGSGTEIAQASASATWTGTPDLYLSPIEPSQFVGVPFGIQWQANVSPCVRTGGQAGDGWTDAISGESWRGGVTLVGLQPGSATYAISCGSGADAKQSSVSTTILPAPPITFTASSTTVGSGDWVTLTWNANTTAWCHTTGGLAGDGWGGFSFQQTGAIPVLEHTIGTVTFGIVCGAMQASVDVTYVAQPAPTLNENVSTAAVGTTIALDWTSSSTSTCNATGGSQDDGWIGLLAPSGSTTLTEQMPGTYSYGLDCGGAGMASVTVIFTASSVDTPPPPVTTALGSSSTSVKASQAFTLTWSSTAADACVASGGSGEDGWKGDLPLAGTMSVSETTAASYTFTVTCSNSAFTALSMVTIAVASQAAGGGGDSGGGGGGGMDLLTLFALAQLVLWRHLTGTDRDRVARLRRRLR